MYYHAANGGKIYNRGQRSVKALTNEGEPVTMAWQVADIQRPLASIGRMCDAGNTAIFTKNGGYIVPEATVMEMINQIEMREERVLRMERETGCITLTCGSTGQVITSGITSLTRAFYGKEEAA